MNEAQTVRRGKAVEWELGYSKTGNEQIGVRFEFLDGDRGSITWYGYFTDKAWLYTVENLKTCGWDGKSLAALDGMGTREVELVLVEDNYDGTPRLKVKYINAPGGGGLAMKMPMTANERRSFAERMQARMGGRPSAPPPAPTPARPDDDLPF